MLGWLWSLPCIVVNRYRASLWYRPHCSVHAWRPVLRRVGLLPPSLVISSVEAGTQAFATELSAAGVPGAVYTPLTSRAQDLRTAMRAMGRRSESAAPDSSSR